MPLAHPAHPLPFITSSHLPERDFAETGRCFAARPEGIDVDTIIVHACYVDPAIRAARGSDIISPGDEKPARDLHSAWQALGSATEESAVRARHRLEFQALAALISARRGESGFDPFSVEAVKDIFQFYGVSAHYLIDREGAIFELVRPELLAFHAGTSRLPSDGRERVNNFSIGIELLATPQDGYTEAQYRSLARLTRQLRMRFPIAHVYGHHHIAPDRKVDPEGFDWKRFIADAGLAESGCNINIPPLS